MYIATLLPDPRVQRAKSQIGIENTPTHSGEPPHALRQHYAVDVYEHNDFPIYSVAPMVFRESDEEAALDELTPQQAANHAVLYIPGGDFVDPITTASWAFVGHLVDSNLRVDIPLVGNLPKYSASDAIPVIQHAYRQLTVDHGASNVTVITDGSGAALALGGLLSFLPHASPAHLILNDPWFNLSPTQWQGDELGLLASYLKNIGSRWAAEDLNNPCANPGVIARREFTQWKSTSVHIFVGGHTQPLRDARQLKQNFSDAGISVSMTEIRATVYLYHLRKTSEGRRARKNMIKIAHGDISLNDDRTR